LNKVCEISFAGNKSQPSEDAESNNRIPPLETSSSGSFRSMDRQTFRGQHAPESENIFKYLSHLSTILIPSEVNLRLSPAKVQNIRKSTDQLELSKRPHS